MISISTKVLFRYINSVRAQQHYDVCVQLVIAFDKMFTYDRFYITYKTHLEMAMQNARIAIRDSILNKSLTN